jgi:predicted ArsR family transcriptional regulator
VENFLKITNGLADPTRYEIYQTIIKRNQPVTVQEIANQFSLHTNVARHHLSKLEELKLVKSELIKTGKGGRPSKCYLLSDKVSQLSFPFRDYELLAKIALQSIQSLGEDGKKLLYDTGASYGSQLIKKLLLSNPQIFEQITIENKLAIIQEASVMLGFYPTIEWLEDEQFIDFSICNCPFKEIAKQNQSVCTMHFSFIEGMFTALFPKNEFQQTENMLIKHNQCSYRIKIYN